jgi:hypothetical protein
MPSPFIVPACEQYYSILTDYQSTRTNHNSLHGSRFIHSQEKENAMNATIHQSAVSAGAKKSVLEAIIPLDPNGDRVRLREGHYVRTRDARGWTVRALTGMLWITQDWDSRDVVLSPGESFMLDRNGTALIWPLGDTDICIGRDRLCSAAEPREHEATPAMAALEPNPGFA